MPEPLPDGRPVVVLAEDEILVRSFLSDALEDAGFRVFEVGQADDALLLLLTRTDVQLLITDVEMDGGSMDGFALARQVRECRPHLGIVVVSGRTAPAPW